MQPRKHHGPRFLSLIGLLTLLAAACRLLQLAEVRKAWMEPGSKST
jgi:hypothetical protein